MFGSRPFSGSSGVHHFSPATLPVVTFKSVFARIAEVRWDFRTSDPMAPQPGEWTYQLSRAANDDPVFDIVFEGSHNEIKVDGLTPSTRYRFKLRIRPAAANGVDWSRQYAQAECQTTDESQLQKAVSQLLRATQEGNAILVAQLLSQYGRELNMETRDRFGKSLLMIACQNGNAEVVKLLIDNGASMAATTQSGKTALSIAVTYGNLKAVESLIALKVDVDQADQGGSTPLMWAVENANGKNGISIIEALLNGGANLNREDGAGQAPFDRLCSTSGNVRAARLMIEFALASTATSPFIMHTGPFSYGGAKVPLVVQRPDKKHPMTSLMSAALNGNKDLCRELIERYGADVTAKTEFGFSALDFAENGGHHAIADMIRAKMKSLEAEFDGEGRSAAAVAAAAAAVAAIATITSAPTGGSVGTLQEPSSKSDSVSRMNTRMTLSKTTRHSSVISIFSIDGDLQPHEVALIKGKQPKALSSVRGRGKQLPAPKSSRSPSRRPSAR
ncbi:ankyrin repeat-containing domain protein [Cladochytrium replicatum]|nr:ankyrin repeat-containing domain protein [Cladochytrium replicatum]